MKAPYSFIIDSAVDRVIGLLTRHVKRAAPRGPSKPVFAYWDGDDRTKLANFIAEWSAVFPTFKVFDNADVIRLIKKYVPAYAETYNAIRIPAAKADIARLILLYEYGGLYIDCHCGICDVNAIDRLFTDLDHVEAIVIDRARVQEPRPPDEFFFINAIIFSRSQSKLLLIVARQALANLACHREFERLRGYIPYNIGALTGPRLLTQMLLQPGSQNKQIRSDYKGLIGIIKEEAAPVARNRHRTYAVPGQHWSERQEKELLFG